MNKELASLRFSRVPISILEDKELTSSAILVFTALSSYANSKMECYPSIETIAHRAHLSRNAARGGLKLLIHHGYVQATHTRNGARQGTNHYILHFQSTFDERSANGLSTQEYADIANQKNEGLNLQSTFDERSYYERSPNALFQSAPKGHELYKNITKQVLRATSSQKTKTKDCLTPDQLKIEKLLKDECDLRGITWDYGKERKNLERLVRLKKDTNALLTIAQKFIDLTKAPSGFLSGKPPTASMLKACLSTVEASMQLPVHDDCLPTADHSFTCPKCGGEIRKGDSGCLHCGFLISEMEAVK